MPNILKLEHIGDFLQEYRIVLSKSHFLNLYSNITDAVFFKLAHLVTWYVIDSMKFYSHVFRNLCHVIQ